MELDRGGGIRSKRWTDAIVIFITVPQRTLARLTAPRYQATGRTVLHSEQ
jgi:hypothetical protein